MNDRQLFVRARAQAECYRRGLDSLADLDRMSRAIAHAEFQMEIQPLLRIKAQLMSFDFRVPTIILHPDGKMETLWPELSSEIQAACRDVDGAIEQVAADYGLI